MSIYKRPQAERDILELAERLGEIYPSIGLAFLIRMKETIELLGRFPDIGSEAPIPDVVDPAIRFVPVKRFRNHLIAYIPVPEGIEIIRVIDGRRDLGTIDFVE